MLLAIDSQSTEMDSPGECRGLDPQVLVVFRCFWLFLDVFGCFWLFLVVFMCFWTWWGEDFQNELRLVF